MKAGRTGVDRNELGSWAMLIVLIILLAAAIVVGYLGRALGSATNMPTTSYIAGVAILLDAGFGLMASIFYSSRNGYDAPPVLILTDR